jgi:hypothetical protein
MSRRFVLTCFAVLTVSSVLKAQTDSLPVQALSTATHRAGISWVKLNDPYLSSLEYSGMGLRVELSEQRYLRATDKRFSMLNRLTGLAAITLNPASTAEIETLAGAYAFGIRYHYRPVDRLVIMPGGSLEADFGVRVNSRNVNNPVNLDIAGNLNATLGARYQLPVFRRTVLLDAFAEVPVVGIMFVPYPGLSYYEMYISKQLSEALFLSSLHNRQGLKTGFSVDIPFRHSTLHAGWRYHQLKYRGNGPVVTFTEHSLLLGISYDVFRSSGRKSKFPAGYVKVL